MQKKAGLTLKGMKSGTLGFFLGTVVGALFATFFCTGRRYKCTPGCCEPQFKNIVERNLLVRDRESYSKTVDISRLRTFSFFVRNDGPHSAMVQPELSPDGTTWGSFGELPQLIKPGEKHIFVLQYFLRYARLKFRSIRPGFETVLTVWFQGQN